MNIQKLIRPDLLKLKPYVCARQNQATGILMDANENPYGRENRYPDPYAKEVRKALVKNLQKESRLLNVKNIFTGNGSDEVIDLLIRLFCGRQDEIMILEPTYGVYSVAATINGVKAKQVLLTEDFQIDLKKVFSAVSKRTKMIFLCSPNNPTGNLLRKNDVIEICKKFCGIVVVDEAYVEFADGKSLTSLIRKYPNLLILRTLSKAWGGAAIRLGYCVANPEIVDFLDRIKAPYNLSRLSQTAALKILSKPISSMIKKITTERDRVSKKLKSFGLKVYPSEANFLLFEVGNAKAVQKDLEKSGLIIRYRGDMPNLQNCLRVSIGTKKENDLFLKKLEQILEKVAFLDRDGALLFEPQETFQIDSIDKYKVLPGVFEGLKRLQKKGFKLVMVSNQNGIGTKDFPEENFWIPQNAFTRDLEKRGIFFDKIFICPHLPSDKCACRKPKIGIVKDYLQETPINFAKSFMFGDRPTDMEFAKNIGVKGYRAKLNSDSLLKLSKKI